MRRGRTPAAAASASARRCGIRLKAIKALDRVRAAQAVNYLKATGLGSSLLLNFGKPRHEIQRIAN